MIHDIEISLVLDLPENPSEEQVLNAVAEALMRKFQDHILDGCIDSSAPCSLKMTVVPSPDSSDAEKAVLGS